jgi:sensor histidine kinase regulating citrate/malate metabolism
MAIGLMLQESSDINEIKESYQKCLDIMRIDDIHIESIHSDINDTIQSFINYKKTIFSNDFNTNIHYYESNAKIPLPVIIYMLGVLLDNAVESGTNKTIYIKVHVSEHHLEVSVSNEYERYERDDFEKMFLQGTSTKAHHGRGYGLSNLKRIITIYSGEILVEHQYNKHQKRDYLTITIEINN